MENIPFSAKTVKGHVYVLMENRGVYVKSVVDQVFVCIKRLKTTARSVMGRASAIITNAGVVVWSVKVVVYALMKN